MGNEYRLRVAIPSKEEGNHALEIAPYFTRFEPSYGFAEYRLNPKQTGMPDVSARLEEYGFYINVHGGSLQVAQAVVGHLVLASSNYGIVEFSELE
jgi:hypothetical protein